MCDFLSKSESLDYYRNKEQWISSKFENILLALLSEKEKWYVRLSGADEISNLISFYDFADRLTKAYSPFFSLDHYFSFSEFENLKQGRKIGRIIDKVVNNNLKQWVQSEYDKAIIELKNASNPDNINKKNQFEKYKKGIYNNPLYAFSRFKQMKNALKKGHIDKSGSRKIKFVASMPIFLELIWWLCCRVKKICKILW